MVNLGYRLQKCRKCGHICQFVGDMNRDAEEKIFCCWCYVESDHKFHNNPTFSIKDFCPVCIARETERQYYQLDAQREQITLLQEDVKKLKEGRV